MGESEMETTMESFLPEIEVSRYTRLERSDGFLSPRSLLIPDELAWALTAERAEKPDADKAGQVGQSRGRAVVGSAPDRRR
jgi:hypothetical protein